MRRRSEESDLLNVWIEGHRGTLTQLAYLTATVAAVLLLNAIISRVIRILTDRASAAGSVWRRVVFASLGRPLLTLVWIAGASVAALLYLDPAGGAYARFFEPARSVALIAVLVWFSLRLVGQFKVALRDRPAAGGRALDPMAADALGKLLQALVVLSGVVALLPTLGVSISGILAFGGIGGIAIGFAAQGLVSNLIGGMTIYASRPFTVGEWIIMPGTEVVGEVQRIGWRATRVMGFDRRPFYVPNAQFNTAVVINHSRMTARRIDQHVHLRYRDVDKVPAIVADVNAMLAEHPGIEHDFFAFRFDSYGDFALKLFLYAFTVSTDYGEFMAVKEDILLKVAGIVKQRGAELAVPTSTVHVPDSIRFEGGTASLPGDG